MQIHSTRLWIILLLIVMECCLVSVLVSMEGIVVERNVTNSSSTAAPVQVSVNLCWSWGAAGSKTDCPLDMLFTQIIIAALALVACLVPAILSCMKERSFVHQNSCVCPIASCEVLCFFLPLFFNITAFLLGITFIAVVIEDNRYTILLPFDVSLSYEMIYAKTWRIGLTAVASLLALMSCIFSGILAAKWRRRQSEPRSHVQSQPIVRQRNERSSLKSSLFVADL